MNEATNRDLIVDAEQLKSKLDLKEVTSRDLETTIAYKEQAIDELKSTNRELEATIAYKDQAVEELKAMNRDLETTIAYKNQAVDEIEATNRDLKADVEQMESKLDISEVTIRGLRIAMTCREQAIDELKASKRDLEASVEQSESNLTSQGIYMSRGEATIQDLGTVNARLLQTQETMSNTLMAEAISLYCDRVELPEDLASSFTAPDVRMFLGVLAGESKVLVRAQRDLGEHKAFIIVRDSKHRRTVWHENLNKCNIEMWMWEWYLCLEKEPHEARLEVRLDDVETYELGRWLNGLGD